jgi:hypothetical protein
MTDLHDKEKGKTTHKCPECKEVKPVTDYYGDRTHLLGYKYICKACHKIKQAKIYYRNPKKKMEKDKQSKTYEKRKKKGLLSVTAKKMREKYPEKYITRYETKKLIQQGKIKKSPCIVCLNPKSEAHHPDYSNPLLVVWLCRCHHMYNHRKYKFPLPIK